jgi:hypothetical protein
LFIFSHNKLFWAISLILPGKDRFLTSNLLYQIADFISKSMTTTTTNYTSNNILQIKAAEKQMESNLMILKNGGNTSNMQYNQFYRNL